MPVFNGASYVRSSIDSVLAQTFDDVELVVVDGGSTDGTVEILKSYGDSIHYWRSERDGGIYDAMNRGVSLARGTLVKIHNADDLMPKESSAEAVKTYRQARNPLSIVRSALATMDEAGEPLGVAGLESPIPWVPAVAHPTWYVPLEVYRRYGLYHTQWRVSSDTEMFYRLEREGVPFVAADKPLALFRSGGASSGTTKIRETFAINTHYQGFGPAAFVAAFGCLSAAPRLLLGNKVETSSTIRWVRRKYRSLWQ